MPLNFHHRAANAELCPQGVIAQRPSTRYSRIFYIFQIWIGITVSLCRAAVIILYRVFFFTSGSQLPAASITWPATIFSLSVIIAVTCRAFFKTGNFVLSFLNCTPFASRCFLSASFCRDEMTIIFKQHAPALTSVSTSGSSLHFLPYQAAHF